MVVTLLKSFICRLIYSLKSCLLILSTLAAPFGLDRAYSSMSLVSPSAPSILSAPPQAAAYACPTGTRALSEDFPTAALVVADFRNVRGEPLWDVAKFIRQVFTLSRATEPIILLATSQSRSEVIISEVGELATPTTRQTWLKQIVSLNVLHYNWLQDFFEVFNRENGDIFFRNVENHPRAPFQMSDIDSVLTANGFSSLPPLNVSGRDGNDRDPKAMPIGGHDGGNIEALPEGICVLGDDQFESLESWQHYARQTCGDLDRVLMAPTYWLAMGHADELTRVLPTPRKRAQDNDSKKDQCLHAIALPNHAHAIALLASQPEQDFLNAETKAILLKNPSAFSGGDWSLAEFCALWKPDRFTSIRSDEERTRLCISMKNRDVIETYQKEPELTLMAELIDQELNDYRRRIREAIQSRRPDCRVEFVDLPTLYMAGATTTQSSQMPNWPYQRSSLNHRGQLHYLDKNLAITLLPNMAGGINVNHSVLTPDPGNDLFRNDVRTQYLKYDVNIEYVDVLLTGHRGLGSLHCMVHSVHACEPTR